MKKFKNLIKIIIFTTIVCTLILIFSVIFVPTWRAGNNIKGLYGEKDYSIDAMFIGDSSIFQDVSPLEIYDKYGISSYDYSTPGVSIMTMYYMLKESTLKQHPKVAIVDVTSIFTANEDEANIRIAIDSMKWGETKKEFVNDPTFNLSLYDKFTYVLPFFRYHTRFDELKGTDVTKLFKTPHNAYKGYYLFYASDPATNKDTYMKDKKEIADFPNSTIPIYLLKMKDYCIKHDIKLLLAAMPDSSVWNLAKSHKISEWAKSNNMTFLDVNLQDTGLDLSKDTHDKGIHLNLYGAIKVSNFLGEYLKDNYDLPDHRNDENYSVWNNDLQTYHQQITDETNIKNEVFDRKYRKKSTPTR